LAAEPVLGHDPIGITILFIVYWKLRGEWAASKGESFDFKGAVFYSIALVLIMYGFSLLPGLQGTVLVLLGIIIMVGFVKLEARTETPLLNVRLFRNKTFALFEPGRLDQLQRRLHDALHTEPLPAVHQRTRPQAAGMILVPNPLSRRSIAPLAGRLSDRINPQKGMASLGMAISTVGTLQLDLPCGRHSDLLYRRDSLVVHCTGFGPLLLARHTNALHGSVEEGGFYGVASAMVVAQHCGVPGTRCSSMVLVLMRPMLQSHHRHRPDRPGELSRPCRFRHRTPVFLSGRSFASSASSSHGQGKQAGRINQPG